MIIKKGECRMEHARNQQEKPVTEPNLFSRRAFIKGCAAAVLLAGLPLDIDRLLADTGIAGGETDHLLMTWTGDPGTTRTVAWRANDPSVPGMAQYVRSDRFRNTGWKHAKNVTATIETVESEKNPIIVNRTFLAGLEPGTAYTFRVGNGREWSRSFTFTTRRIEERPFSFLVFGDSQSGHVENPEYGPWGRTVNNAFRANPDVKFMMNVGDLVEEGESRIHWEKWFEAARSVLEKIPNMAVLGNHETYTSTGTNHTVLPASFRTQIALPPNGPAPLKGQVYSFDYGNVHFSILDSQEKEEERYIPGMLRMQAEWLDRDLASTRKKWKLVFFHKTLYYNKASRANEALKAAFQPVIDRHSVDIVFNGHDHGYSRTWPIREDTFTDSPAKGTVYLVTGRSGNKSYQDLSQKVWNAFFYDPQTEPNYIVVKVDGNRLTVSAFTQSGRTIDRYTIDKARGTDQPVTLLPERATETRLVVWGNMLRAPLLKVPPAMVAGTWHVPLRPFFEFIGGTVELRPDGKIAVRYEKSVMTFAVNSAEAFVNENRTALSMPIADSKGEPMLPVVDLKTLAGFSTRYDDNMNMLFIAR
ncbi:MAG: twin-arginine translocation signal domain-containing protein [Chlorobiaceae bacterium]|nr:twin-arginine translocation signal domain-containing protein [Chlorobiaceae bacterium]